MRKFSATQEALAFAEKVCRRWTVVAFRMCGTAHYVSEAFILDTEEEKDDKIDTLTQSGWTCREIPPGKPAFPAIVELPQKPALAPKSSRKISVRV